MDYFLSFLHSFDDNVRTSPSRIFSEGMCRIRLKSSEIRLKMLSDHLRQKNLGQDRLKLHL